MALRTLPPFTALAGGILGVAAVVMIFWLPWHLWPAYLTPRAWDRDTIEHEKYVPLAPRTDDGCLYYSVRAWQRMRDAGGPPDQWYQMARQAPTGAGWALALAGLRFADSSRFAAVIDSLRAPEDSIGLLEYGERVRSAPVAELRRLLVSGGLTTLLDTVRSTRSRCSV